MNKIYFTKLNKNAILPSREGNNAGWDIYALQNMETIIIKPSETKLIETGIASIIPDGYYMQIQERSSTGSKGIKYSCGVIDSNYRGEWKLALYNSTDKHIIITNDTDKFYNDSDYIVYPLNKALFQAVIHETHKDMVSEELSLIEFNKYKDTDRGDKGFGSTGK